MKLIPYNVLDENDTELTRSHPFGDVEIIRSMKADQWNTFCVPITMEIPEGWTVKKMSSAEDKGDYYYITFEETNRIDAGVPYIVKPEEAVTDWMVENTTIDPTLHNTVEGDITFTGNMYKTTVPVGSYFVSDSKFYQVPEGTTVNLNGFRAVFTPADPSSVKALKYGVDETTFIQTTDMDYPVELRDVYNLSGQRVQTLSRGFYIINGKKVFIK